MSISDAILLSCGLLLDTDSMLNLIIILKRALSRLNSIKFLVKSILISYAFVSVKTFIIVFCICLL